MKNVYYTVSRQTLLTFLCLILTSSFLIAQRNASRWETFVFDSSVNPLLTDTFRFQSFEGNQLDTWNYTTTSGAVLFDASTDLINGQGGKYSLKLPPENEVVFEAFDPTLYQNVRMYASYAAYGVGEKGELQVESNRKSGLLTQGWAQANKSGYMLHYRQTAYVGGYKNSNPILIADSPMDLTIRFTSSNVGYFCLDSVLVKGDIGTYSLFQGKGNWNESSLWSHLPVYRHRKAIINGDVSIHESISCKEIILDQASLSLNSSATLNVGNLILYNQDYALLASGEIDVSEQVTIKKDFPEKGKWYFLSFPFDVYMECIDKKFELKDDAPNGGGNYLYALSYDGVQRAISEKAEGNWKVIKSTELHGKPLFEKGKGYLIAIDEQAHTNEVSFASRPGEIPENFGGDDLIIIPEVQPVLKDIQHQGWHLCGNPLPAPLRLDQLSVSAALDGYIYYYNGEGYTPYKIGSNYVLPPLAAFFVKSSAATPIHITHKEVSTHREYVSIDIPVSASKEEPIPIKTDPAETEKVPLVKVIGNTLSISDLPATGNLYIMDSIGRIIFQQIVSADTTSIHLPFPAGIYILNIVTGCYNAQYKFILT